MASQTQSSDISYVVMKDGEPVLATNDKYKACKAVTDNYSSMPIEVLVDEHYKVYKILNLTDE